MAETSFIRVSSLLLAPAASTIYDTMMVNIRHTTAVTTSDAFCFRSSFCLTLAYFAGDEEGDVAQDLIRPLASGGSRPEPSSLPLSKGALVEARYANGDAWFLGRIASFSRGGYDIIYDDGDEEEGVPESLVRPYVPSQPSTRQSSPSTSSSASVPLSVSSARSGDPYAPGTHVEARFGGGAEWYSGVVVSNSMDRRVGTAALQGTVAVAYDDVDEEVAVPTEHLRLLHPSDGASGAFPPPASQQEPPLSMGSSSSSSSSLSLSVG